MILKLRCLLKGEGAGAGAGDTLALMLKEIMRGFDEDMYDDEAAANNDAMVAFLGLGWLCTGFILDIEFLLCLMICEFVMAMVLRTIHFGPLSSG